MILNIELITIIDNKTIIPTWLFETTKRSIPVEVPFCLNNEKVSKRFLNRLKQFTHENYEFKIIWKTKKVQNLFNNKDRNNHSSCVIYEGVCSCSANYIGETKRNEVRWKEHENPKNNSELARHLLDYPDHKFTWKIIMPASKNNKIRKAQEAFYIVLNRPILNEQLENNLLLFRNGVT